MSLPGVQARLYFSIFGSSYSDIYGYTGFTSENNCDRGLWEIVWGCLVFDMISLSQSLLMYLARNSWGSSSVTYSDSLSAAGPFRWLWLTVSLCRMMLSSQVRSSLSHLSNSIVASGSKQSSSTGNTLCILPSGLVLACCRYSVAGESVRPSRPSRPSKPRLSWAATWPWSLADFPAVRSIISWRSGLHTLQQDQGR